MKKALLFLLIISLFTACPACAPKTSSSQKPAGDAPAEWLNAQPSITTEEFPLAEYTWAASIAIAEDGSLWTACNEKLYHYDAGGEILAALDWPDGPDERTCPLSLYHDTLYIAKNYDTSFQLYTMKARDDAAPEPLGEEMEGFCRSLAAFSKNLALTTVSGTSSEKANLRVIDLEDGTEETLPLFPEAEGASYTVGYWDEETIAVYSLPAFGGGVLQCVKQDENGIWQSVKTGALGSYQFAYLYGAPWTENIFYTTNDECGYIDRETCEFTRLLSAKSLSGITAVVGNNEKLLVATKGNEGYVLRAYSLEALRSPETVLSIWATKDPISQPISWMISSFEEAHPGVHVEYHVEDDASRITTALMGGVDNIDILVLDDAYTLVNCSLQNSRLLNYYKAGLLANLSDYPEAVQWSMSEDIIPGYLNSCMVDGQWVGVPISTFSACWGVDTAVLRQEGISLPEPNWTWDDVFDMMETSAKAGDSALFMLQANSLGIESSAPPFLNSYAVNYLDLANGLVNFDEPIFRRLMQRWKTAVEEGWYVSTDQKVEGKSAISQANFPLMKYSEFLPAPVFDAQHDKESIFTYMMAVNKTGEHSDLAVEFLLHCLSREQNISISTGNEFAPFLYRMDNLSDFDTELGVNNAKERGFTKEIVQIYQAQAHRCAPTLFSQDLAKALEEICVSYSRGEIALEETIAKLNRKTDQILNE